MTIPTIKRVFKLLANFGIRFFRDPRMGNFRVYAFKNLAQNLYRRIKVIAM